MAQPGLEGRVGAEEWRGRVDLAAMYRIFDHLGWTDLLDTHMSVRVPGEPDRFLINHYEEMFDEITASGLIKMDLDGKNKRQAASKPGGDGELEDGVALQAEEDLFNDPYGVLARLFYAAPDAQSRITTCTYQTPCTVRASAALC